MTMLHRLLGRRPKRSPWPFERVDQLERFGSLVVETLVARGERPRVEGHLVHVEGDGHDPIVLGLTNLAQVCAQIPEDEWAAAVSAQLDQMTQPDAADALDWDAAQPLLKPRLWRRSDIESLVAATSAREMIRRRLAPDLDAVLAFDLPTVVRTVEGDALARWNVSIDEAYGVAIANLRAEDVPAEDRIVGLDLPVTVVAGDSHFVASRILCLDERLAPVGPGALVAVPNRHSLVLHRIVDRSAMRAVAVMVRIARHGFDTGPGSITPDVFWWHAGTLTALPVGEEGRDVAFDPPAGFVALLESLPPERRP